MDPNIFLEGLQHPKLWLTKSDDLAPVVAGPGPRPVLSSIESRAIRRIYDSHNGNAYGSSISLQCGIGIVTAVFNFK